jgi:hypothetical protein
MKPAALADYLQFTIDNNFPILIKGKPGIGKSDIVTQSVSLWERLKAKLSLKAKLIISHPVVSDPTDYKGLPFPKKDGTADFLPFGDLQQIITAKEKTIFFLDDLGQASPSVQAACMQLLLARRINGHMVSNHVTFIAATNRREDKAAVSGMLEPVKSRFASIVELEVDTEDWIKWALGHDIPTELIAFIRFRPELLDKFEPTKEIQNSPSPRTIAYVGKQQAAGLPEKFEFEAFKGAAGEAFATEYKAFLKLYRQLPSLDEIILNPSRAPIPSEPGALYAISGALANKMNDQNIGSICTYLDRLPPENSVACMKDAVTKNRSICNNRAFIQWQSDKTGVLI